MRPTIEQCFAKPVIPVLWEISTHRELVSQASSVILQGGTIVDLQKSLEIFEHPSLQNVRVFVHIDLVAGLENNEAGLEFLAKLPCIDGVVSIHHQLARAAKRLGLLSVIRLFLTDSRAMERGLSIAAKSQADAIEIMPAAVAAKTFNDFQKCALPRIAGGLCRTEQDLQEALDSGILAITSTRPKIWRFNR